MTQTLPLPDRFYDAFLFDMDGTILSSIPAVERAWTAWANRVGVAPAAVLAYLHGRRAIDTIRHFAPAGWDLQTEVAWLDACELEDMAGVAPLAGAAALLAALPAHRWAVVTSANRALAQRRIVAAGLPLPALLISSDDVTHGKPHPQGYQLAAAQLGHRIDHCLVFEDTRAGLAAGRAAGADVIHILGTEAADTPAPALRDYASVTLQLHETGIGLI